MSLAKAIKIARIVRKTFDAIASEESRTRKWHTGCPDTLEGYCGRASAQLYLALRREGLRSAEFWDGDCHSFVTYRGKIIDITATQFGSYPDVHVCDFDDTVSTRNGDSCYCCPTRNKGVNGHWAYTHEDKLMRKTDLHAVKKALEF